MNKDFIHVSCPMCDCIKGDVIIENDLGHLKKCDNCELIYLCIRPIKEKYKTACKNYLPSTADDYKKFQKRIKEAKKDFKIINEHIEKGRLFDVGASSGIFAHVGKTYGWKVSGSEISERCIKYSKHTFDIDLLYGFIEDLKFQKDSFELVTMIQVIEHLLKPIQELTILKNTLVKEGYMYIDTPIFAENLEILKENHMIPYHTNDFTEKTLLKMLDKVGLEIIFSKRYIYNKLPYIELLCKKRK